MVTPASLTTLELSAAWATIVAAGLTLAAFVAALITVYLARDAGQLARETRRDLMREERRRRLSEALEVLGEIQEPGHGSGQVLSNKRRGLRVRLLGLAAGEPRLVRTLEIARQGSIDEEGELRLSGAAPGLAINDAVNEILEELRSPRETQRASDAVTTT